MRRKITTEHLLHALAFVLTVAAGIVIGLMIAEVGWYLTIGKPAFGGM
jgi:hypothetical protein